MPEKIRFLSLFGFPFIFLDIGDFHHMGYMMDWLNIPYWVFWWISIWVIQFLVAFVVFRDAEKRESNGFLWFFLVILPWFGLIFLVVYLILRGEEESGKEAVDESDKILDRRYAQGEITQKEYLEAKEAMEKMKR